ncbi:MAG: peptide chain release factor 2 [Deltaproteobacteria bacterium]|nr:peptide chain release factor 2 [Deltaproteobacteria bacterium]
MFDIDARIKELAHLEEMVARPDIWEKGEAQNLLKSVAILRESIESFQKKGKELEEGEILLGLAIEASDQETAREVENRLTEIERGIRDLEVRKMLGGEHDKHHAIVSIHPGAGGTEAQDWAEMLLRMYLRWAEGRGFKVEIVDYQPGEEAGVKSVTFTVEGDYAYGYLKAESGVHRLVRISPFDASHRRHTSFASVFVYPEIEEDIEIDIKETDLRIDTYRSSGAGGQHVNKTDSAVRITHIPTGIVVQCQNERSQHKNRATAMKILRARFYDLKLKEQEEKLKEFHRDKKEIAWGNQIRSYTLHPYRLVKDHRTGMEVGNADAVLDGRIDEFIETYLLKMAREEAVGR